MERRHLLRQLRKTVHCYGQSHGLERLTEGCPAAGLEGRNGEKTLSDKGKNGILLNFFKYQKENAFVQTLQNGHGADMI